MTERASGLLDTARRQIEELIDVLSVHGDASLRRPCAGRQRLGDGTVGAAASHTATTYLRIAAFVDAARTGAHGDHTPAHSEHHGAGNVALHAVIERLSDASKALEVLADLTDEQLDVVPAASAMRFCDGRRTLEEIARRMLRHQRHQGDAIVAALR